MKYYTLIALFSLLLSACQAAPAPTAAPTTIPTVQPTATEALSPELQAYLENALDLIQENSIYSATADWETVRAHAYLYAAGALTTADLYSAIEFALDETGDRHGYIMPPVDADSYFNSPVEDSIPAPRQELLLDRLGYLSVPTFASGHLETAIQFAGQLQAAVQSLDAQNPCGWVLDLRGNEGGNGFAMLLGVSPLLPEGTLGLYTYNGGETLEWRTQGAQIYMGDVLIMELSVPAYRLRNPGAPVAVLTNEITTSGGEFVAVAFRGWPYTLSFGQRTWGLPTAPEGFFLSDGAILGISVAYYTDHTGQIYQGKIVPEEPIPAHDDPTMRDDSVPQQAIDWLLAQPACIGK